MSQLDRYFGEFGGQYVPQILLPALDQLEQAFIDARKDPEFISEFSSKIYGQGIPIVYRIKIQEITGKFRESKN